MLEAVIQILEPIGPLVVFAPRMNHQVVPRRRDFESFPNSCSSIDLHFGGRVGYKGVGQSSRHPWRLRIEFVKLAVATKQQHLLARSNAKACLRGLAVDVRAEHEIGGSAAQRRR